MVNCKRNATNSRFPVTKSTCRPGKASLFNGPGRQPVNSRKAHYPKPELFQTPDRLQPADKLPPYRRSSTGFAPRSTHPPPIRRGYDLSEAGPDSISGREIAALFDGRGEAGGFRIPVDASALQDVVYFLPARSNGAFALSRMVVLKR